jgi:hypothetical protein
MIVNGSSTRRLRSRRPRLQPDTSTVSLLFAEWKKEPLDIHSSKPSAVACIH